MITSLRRGCVLEPNGSCIERGGVLNPAAIRSRDGELLLYPRVVEPGNVSRIGIVRVTEAGGRRAYVRNGFALVPERDYELRAGRDGYAARIRVSRSSGLSTRS
jgi:hypothetical protein